MTTNHRGDCVVVIELAHGNCGNVLALPYTEAAKLRAALNAMILVEEGS